MRKLRGGRNEHEKAPEVVGHGWLQLRRGSVMATVVETAGGPHLRTIRCSKLAEMVKLGKAKLPASWSEVEGDGERAQAQRDNGGAVAPLRRFW